MYVNHLGFFKTTERVRIIKKTPKKPTSAAVTVSTNTTPPQIISDSWLEWKEKCKLWKTG